MYICNVIRFQVYLTLLISHMCHHIHQWYSAKWRQITYLFIWSSQFNGDKADNSIPNSAPSIVPTSSLGPNYGNWSGTSLA